MILFLCVLQILCLFIEMRVIILRKLLLGLFLPECLVETSEYASQHSPQPPPKVAAEQAIDNEGNNLAAGDSTPAEEPRAFISVLIPKFDFLLLLFRLTPFVWH